MKFDRPLNTVKTRESGDKDDSYGPMPVGDYLGVIDEATEEVSKNGNAMIKLVIKLKGNERYDNKLIFHYIVNAGDFFLEKVVRMLNALNQSTDIDNLDVSTLTGLACKIHTKHEEYNGEIKDALHYFVAIDPIQQAQLSGSNKVHRPLKEVEDDMSIPF